MKIVQSSIIGMIVLSIIACGNDKRGISISEEDFDLALNQASDFTAVVSDDEKLQLYSRDNGLGGTMRIYDNLFLFQGNEKTYYFKGTIDDYLCDEKANEDESELGTFYDGIITINLTGKTIYLVGKHNKLQTGDNGICVSAYTIENDHLYPAKVFHKHNEYVSSFQIECHWCDHERLFYYDEQENILYVPIAENEYAYSCPIEQFDKYQLQNRGFEFIESVGKRFWLHKSLRNFLPASDGVTKEFDTTHFHIRIDETEDDKYRYASWAKGKSTTDKPDLVIANGKKIENDFGHWHYVFNNKEYSYSCEFDLNEDDNSFIGVVLVTKNGKQILKESIIQ